MKTLLRLLPLMMGGVILVSMTVSFGCAAHAQTAGRAVDLISINGQKMPAQIENVSGQDWKISSPLFEGNADVDVSALSAVRFRNTTETRSLQGTPFQFQLTTGEVIVGSLNSIGPDRVSLVHADLGMVSFPRQQIALISSIGQESQQLSTLDLPVSNSKAALGPFGTMRLKQKERLPCPFPLKNDAQITVSFYLRPTSEFRILFNSEEGNAGTVTVSGDGVMSQIDSLLDFANIKLRSGRERLTFLLDDQNLVLRDRLGREVLRQPFPENVQPNIEVISDGALLDVLAFESDSIRPVTPTSNDPTNVVVVDSSGGSLGGKEIVIGNGVAEIELNDGSVKKAPLEDVATIAFSNTTPVDPSEPFAIAQWKDRTRLAIDGIEVQQAALSLQHQSLKSKNALASSTVSALFFAQNNRRRKRNTEALVIGTSPFAGEFQWGETDSPLWWKFPSFKNAVPLDLRRKVSISMTQSHGADSADFDDEHPDRVLLKNGTILPCRILTVAGNAIQLESTYIDTGKISRTQLRGCFFNVGPSFDSNSATKESIGRALTVPRFAQGLEPTSILVASNGDLLRGDLISIDQNEIAFDSRAQLLRIQRQGIKAIVTLDEVLADAPAATPPSTDEISIDYGNSFVLVGKLNRDQSDLILNVAGCGDVRLPNQGIRSVRCNADLKSFSALYRYADWNPIASEKPRWAEPQEPSKDVRELVGKPAPDFELPTVSGERFVLSDQRGKVIVLSFWATWCQPCLMGMPDHLKMMENFSSEEAILVPINQAETSSVIRTCLEDQSWKLTVPMDIDRAVSGKFHVTAIPHVVVIDTDGNVAHVGVGYSPKNVKSLQKIIKDLL